MYSREIAFVQATKFKNETRRRRNKKKKKQTAVRFPTHSKFKMHETQINAIQIWLVFVLVFSFRRPHTNERGSEREETVNCKTNEICK